MMRFKKLHLLLLLVVLTGVLAAPIRAERNIDVVVKTVLASHGAKYFDPRLSSVIEELQSVFRYSSYRLLSQDRTNLRVGETGVVSLPGNRILKITPMGVTENRVELRLVILKKRRAVFETVIQLLNHGSIIVGGPKHKDGSLLFNISASF